MIPAWLKNLSDEEVIRHFQDEQLTELEADLLRRLADHCNVETTEIPLIVREQPNDYAGN